MTVVKTYRRISILLGVLLGVLIATNGERHREVYAYEIAPELRPRREIAAEILPASRLEPDLTLKDLEEPVTDVELTAPPPRWILRHETWKAMAESRYNLDVSLEPGREYIGVRVVLPFGS